MDTVEEQDNITTPRTIYLVATWLPDFLVMTRLAVPARGHGIERHHLVASNSREAGARLHQDTLCLPAGTTLQQLRANPRPACTEQTI